MKKTTKKVAKKTAAKKTVSKKVTKKASKKVAPVKKTAAKKVSKKVDPIKKTAAKAEKAVAKKAIAPVEGPAQAGDLWTNKEKGSFVYIYKDEANVLHGIFRNGTKLNDGMVEKLHTTPRFALIVRTK